MRVRACVRVCVCVCLGRLGFVMACSFISLTYLMCHGDVIKEVWGMYIGLISQGFASLDSLAPSIRTLATAVHRAINSSRSLIIKVYILILIHARKPCCISFHYITLHAIWHEWYPPHISYVYPSRRETLVKPIEHNAWLLKPFMSSYLFVPFEKLCPLLRYMLFLP
jgi:hypothetical protein